MSGSMTIDRDRAGRLGEGHNVSGNPELHEIKHYRSRNMAGMLLFSRYFFPYRARYAKNVIDRWNPQQKKNFHPDKTPRVNAG